MKRKMLTGLSALALSSVMLVGCAEQQIIEKPTKVDAFLERVEKGEPMPVEEILAYIENDRDEFLGWGEGFEFPVHPAEKYLKGWTIVLDPGHGGDAHKKNWKRGPTGVREAAINLRVALILKALLENSGAQVKLTRADDSYDMSLAERAEVANTIVRTRDGGIGADLFVSLHHNASGPTANYTSIWFHGPVKWSEPDLDPAKYVAHELGWALRTQVAKTSPIMNDQQMFKNGFGVLKMTRVPAFLCESSFHSHAEEEQRLRDAEYNLREAYAIYKGLAEYAYGGRPTQDAPIVKIEGSEMVIETVLDDGSDKGWWGHDKERTVASTVNVNVNGVAAFTKYDAKSKKLIAKVAVTDLPEAEKYEVWVHHQNMFKHSNYPQRYGVAFNEGLVDGAKAEAEAMLVKRNGIDD